MLLNFYFILALSSLFYTVPKHDSLVPVELHVINASLRMETVILNTCTPVCIFVQILVIVVPTKRVLRDSKARLLQSKSQLTVL